MTLDTSIRMPGTLRCIISQPVIQVMVMTMQGMKKPDMISMPQRAIRLTIHRKSMATCMAPMQVMVIIAPTL